AIRQTIDTAGQRGRRLGALGIDVAAVHADRGRAWEAQLLRLLVREDLVQLDRDVEAALGQHVREQLERLGVRRAPFPEVDVDRGWLQGFLRSRRKRRYAIRP